VINGSVALSGGTADAPLAGTLSAGDGLGFGPGLGAAVAAGSPEADLLVFELR
jgi:hypothetical protein